MGSEAEKPVIFLAFANERDDLVRYLRNLPEEARNIREILESAKRDGLCDFKEIPNATLKEILDVFQNPSYKDSIAVFHYAGHANSYQLMLESPEGRTTAAYAGGLASFLGQQTGLELVFLNGCATQKQVQGLLDANVSAVISTSRAIDDKAATEFATRFYKGLAGGSSIRRAYKEAEAAMKTAHGDDSRSLYAREGSAIDHIDDRVPLDHDRLPWDPGLLPGADLAAQWVMATEFASRFYRGLVGGDDIQRAYNEARAATKTAPQTARGSNTRNLYLAECRSADMVDDRLPWDLYLRDGAEKADQWSLPKAVNDPLFGLPPIPEGDLPPSPFRHLSWFDREHADVFFGRGYEIRDLYQRVIDRNSAPIILFYGQSGVGKSSVLAAGLLPRLERDYEIPYARRDGKKGLLGTLKEKLSPKEGMTISESWMDQESRTGRPLIVIVDQVEEAFTRPNPDLPHELDEFWDALQAIFSDPGHRPQGKLILGFRKEWLAEIEKQLMERKTPFSRMLLERLSRRGIIESVSGPASSERLRQNYGLTVENGLPEIIADDLREDRESAVAPTMQILLTKMWEAAKDKDHEHPLFDQDLYQSMKKKGILLQDFLDQQLDSLKEWNSEIVNSGLALDVLAFHTTTLGTAEERTAEELEKNYHHQSQVVNRLIQRYEDLYLLEPLNEATRLSHDTLAPLVRKLFNASDKPGQRARRILESRSVDWQDGKQGTPVDEQDLELVERGKDGMRAWEPEEGRLVEASREERERKRHKRQFWKGVGVAVVVLILTLSALAYYQMVQANEKTEEALARSLASESSNLIGDPYGDPHDKSLTLGVLLAIESIARRETQAGIMALQNGMGLLPYPMAKLNHDNIPINDLAFSPDGRFIATGGNDNSAKIWDARSGKELSHMVINRNDNPYQFGLDSGIWDLEFDPNSNILATASLDGTVSLWNVPDGVELARTGYGEAVMNIKFSPDGKWLAAIVRDGNIGVGVLDATTGQHIRNITCQDSIDSEVPQIVTAIAFSPASDLLATGGYDNTCRIWDISTGRELTRMNHSEAIRDIQFSPDGRLLATSAQNAGHVVGYNYGEPAIVWNISTGLKELELYHEGNVDGIAFSLGGEYLATAGEGTIRLWDISAKREIRRINLGRMPIQALIFSSDGKYIAAVCNNINVIVWDILTGEEIARIRHDKANVVEDALSPDGRYIATWNTYSDLDMNAIIWDLSEPIEPIRLYHQGPLFFVVFSPNGHEIATASLTDSTVILWNASTRKEIVRMNHNGLIDLAFSFDGRYIATQSDEDKKIKIWDIVTRTESTEMSYNKTTSFSPIGAFLTINGNLIALPSDKEATWDAGKARDFECWISRLINKSDASDQGSVQSSEINAARLSPDGEILVLAINEQNAGTGSVRIFNASTGEELRRMNDTSMVSDIEFSPDGKYIVTVFEDRTPIIWDVSSGSKLNQFDFKGRISVVDFNSNGSRLATGSADKSARIWDFATGKEIMRINHLDWVVNVDFSPDGKYLATASRDNIGRLWLLGPKDMIEEARHRITRNLTDDERREYLGST